MEEGLKNKLIFILIILSCIFLVIAFESCNKSHKNKISLEQEMVTRMELEENLHKAAQGKNSLLQELNSIKSFLEEEKASHQATKKSLVQEQLVNQSLTEELQKITKLKEALEEDLKEALLAASQDKKPVLKK